VKIRVLLADDHTLIRQGILMLLKDVTKVEVVGEASNGREAVCLAEKLKPDVVILDIAMPDLNGVEAARRIRAASADTRVLALSMHSDRQFVEQMFEAGASGYLVKSSDIGELADALDRVARGEIYLGPPMGQELLKEYARTVTAVNPESPRRLTSRQAEVLQMISEGKTTKEIAAALKVSLKTVETYRRQIMARLDIHSIAGLTKYAVRAGLTAP
jgi:two-component system, NarL family, response regulator NreC